MWSWLERPDNRLRLARFGAAMTGLRNMTRQDALLTGLSFFFFYFVDHLIMHQI